MAETLFSISEGRELTAHTSHDLGLQSYASHLRRGRLSSAKTLLDVDGIASKTLYEFLLDPNVGKVLARAEV
ncbi:hypothetical protein J1614_005576 [Plenodomus biglobosus]|nr:hypothetical protein J1614_005576 [Plenodomus biglobosus]